MAQDQTPDASGVSRRGLLQGRGVRGRRGPRGGPAPVRLSHTGVPATAPAPADRTGLRQPGSLPDPRRPAGTDTIPQIEHIVVVMMENHSYDNHLGMLRRPGADGFRLGWNGRPLASNPYPDGRVQHAFRMPTTCQLSGHPAQDWLASHVQYDGGRLDGFVKSASGPVSMGYWQQADLPFYYSLARQFPIADRYFCSVLGQTYPNRRYLMAATSIGQVDDTLPGADRLPGQRDHLRPPRRARHYLEGLFHQPGHAGALPPLYLKNQGTKIVPIAGFFTDAAAGTLPGFCLVEPEYGTADEENPQNIARGEAFAAQVINAVMAGPAWERTLLVWTFDEHGGYYDHVPPPRAVPPDAIPPAVPAGQQAYDGFGRYGFRVPAAIVSPWARPFYVSHQVFDHASICKLAETKWNLPAMTYRDANAATCST